MNELRRKMKCIDGHCYSVSCKGFLRVIKEAGVSVIQAIRTLVWSNIVEKVHKCVASSSPTLAFIAVFIILFCLALQASMVLSSAGLIILHTLQSVPVVSWKPTCLTAR